MLSYGAMLWLLAVLTVLQGAAGQLQGEAVGLSCSEDSEALHLLQSKAVRSRHHVQPPPDIESDVSEGIRGVGVIEQQSARYVVTDHQDVDTLPEMLQALERQLPPVPASVQERWDEFSEAVGEGEDSVMKIFAKMEEQVAATQKYLVAKLEAGMSDLSRARHDAQTRFSGSVDAAPKELLSQEPQLEAPRVAGGSTEVPQSTSGLILLGGFALAAAVIGAIVTAVCTLCRHRSL